MAEPDRAAMALKSGYDGSVQGVDGRRYRVDEDASAYYDEIAAALEACDARARAAESEDVAAEAREESRAIGSNALEGADGRLASSVSAVRGDLDHALGRGKVRWTPQARVGNRLCGGPLP